jgi:DNA-binding MarR family transcriptional regulator
MAIAVRSSARIVKNLSLIAQAIKRASLTEGESLKLTPVQAQTILFIRHTRPDAASIGHLARSLATSHATAVGVVDALERRGLVERRPSDEDRRVTLLALSADGRAMAERLDGWNSTLTSSIESLDLTDRMWLVEGLGALVQRLSETGHVVVSEPCPGCIHFVADHRPGADRPHFCHVFGRHLSAEETEYECPKHTPAG